MAMGKRLARLYRAPAQKSEAREAFLALGEEQPVARVLAALVDLDDPTAAEIADYTGYTYGTVVKTVAALDDRNWIASREVASPRRGRNPNGYTLTVSKAGLQRHYRAILTDRLTVVQAMLT